MTHHLPGTFNWRDPLARDPEVGDIVVFVPHENADVVMARVRAVHSAREGSQFMELDLELSGGSKVLRVGHCNDMVAKYHLDPMAKSFISYWISRYEFEHQEERFSGGQG